MADLFYAYEVKDPESHIRAYLIESTAPNNIDDPETTQHVPENTGYICADVAISRIAEYLIKAENPTLVVSIHGFNNPRNIILPGYWNSFNIANNDKAIKKAIQNDSIVVIGYRWPSEKMGDPVITAFKAAPTFLKWLFAVGFALVTATFGWHQFRGLHEIAIFSIGIFAMIIAFTLFLLRVAVYFRDGYRATSFGVPDLVQIIQQIDKKFNELDKSRGRQNTVNLSFIGHSMGAFVVTSVVRILSDVFDADSMRESLNSVDASPSPNIGHAFQLARLVLVSPDIPAEALIASRANFLSASLKRFEEAFLFSNEGDEVLRQISTTANYFSFPTKSSKFGYRLGNIRLLTPPGITRGVELKYLQIGQLTLEDIYKKIATVSSGHLRKDLPEKFSYFDCTESVENGRGVLTLAKPGRINKMCLCDHFWLLLLYLVRPRRFDVHGGYFRSDFLSKLIYRLACLGLTETEQSYKDDTATMDSECAKHQVRVLLTTKRNQQKAPSTA
jgi:hypothetical protein